MDRLGYLGLGPTLWPLARLEGNQEGNETKREAGLFKENYIKE